MLPDAGPPPPPAATRIVSVCPGETASFPDANPPPPPGLGLQDPAPPPPPPAPPQFPCIAVHPAGTVKLSGAPLEEKTIDPWVMQPPTDASEPPDEAPSSVLPSLSKPPLAPDPPLPPLLGHEVLPPLPMTEYVSGALA